MDILTTGLSAIVVKLYDDLVDNNIIVDGFPKECLHTLSCFLLAASSMNDFIYALILYLVNLSAHFSDSDAFSQLHEKTILYMFPVFFILALPSIRSLYIAEILFLVAVLPFGFIEASGMKEEASVRKLLLRGFAAALSIAIISIGWFFRFLSRSLLKILLFFTCYLLASCGFQTYSLLRKHNHDLVTNIKDIIQDKKS